MTTRIRSTDLRQAQHIRLVAYNPPPNNVTPYANNTIWGSTPGVGYSSTVTDEPHPGFRKRMARGEIIMGSFEKIWAFDNESPVTVLHAGPWSDWGEATWTGCWGSMVGTYIPVSLGFIGNTPSYLRDTALVKAYAKMNEAPLLSGELMATFGQTVGMLRKPMHGMQSLLKKMIKYKNIRAGKTVKSTLKAQADAWLEYRYGWKPLLLDCETAIDLVHDVRDGVWKRLVARAGESSDLNVLRPYSISSVKESTSLTSAGTVDIRYAGSANAGVIYQVSPGTPSDRLLQNLGLRARDLAPTIWELLPFSFVVDWTVNVSEWLQAVTPNPDVTILGSWVTYKSTTDITKNGSMIFKKPSPLGTDTTIPVRSTTQWGVVRRQINAQLPSHPVVQRKPLSRPRMADAVELATNQILGLMRDFRR